MYRAHSWSDADQAFNDAPQERLEKNMIVKLFVFRMQVLEERSVHAAALREFLESLLKPGLYLLLAMVWVILSSVTSLPICKLTRTTTNCSIVVSGW